MKRILTPIVLTVAVAAGCGGTTEPVPNVVGERLDVAKSLMSDAGHETEELGGGTFGIIDESNWVVCETRPVSGATTGSPVKLIVERSCESSAAATEAAEEESVVEADAVLEEEEQDAAAPAPARTKKIRVPDVIGMDHQRAQDTMQAAGLYILAEEDASGLGRMLLYDRNWTVVRQSPKAGKRVGENRTITLFSIKDDER